MACMPCHCDLNPGTRAPQHKESVGVPCKCALATPSGAGIGACAQEVTALLGSAGTEVCPRGLLHICFSLNLVLGNIPS